MADPSQTPRKLAVPTRALDVVVAMFRRFVTRKAKRSAPALVAMLALGGVAGYFAVPPRAPSPEVRAAPRVTLAGEPLPIEDPRAAIASARAIVRAHLRGKIQIVGPNGDKRELSRAEIGARLDEARLLNLLAQARDPESAMRRRARGAIELPLPITTSERAALSATMQIKDELDREPIEARYDASAHAMQKERSGLRVDALATLARLDRALASGASRVEAAFSVLPPKRNVEGAIETSDVLGYFETRYVPDRKHADRTFNLKLAASKLDGYVVMPGEEFDFNQVVGPRSEVYGYRAAPVIAEGELADGIGGGTCQIAGTLHAAVLFAGLPILERHPHTRPSYYIKMGLDAAVAYPALSMRFRNDTSDPIVVHETVQGGIVRAEILGKKRSRDTLLVRVIDDAIPFGEREVQDPKLPRGRRVLGQRGIPGFHVTRTRLVRDQGVLFRVESDEGRYPPTAQVWRVGTGPYASEPAEDDAHPEYVGDEFLEMLQGPSFGTSCSSPFDPACTTPAAQPGGGSIELRDPGRFGNYGWTRRFQASSRPQG